MEAAVASVGFCPVPEHKKVAKWTLDVDTAIKTNRLAAGEASKLAGRLVRAASRFFSFWPCAYFAYQIVSAGNVENSVAPWSGPLSTRLHEMAE